MNKYLSEKFTLFLKIHIINTRFRVKAKADTDNSDYLGRDSVAGFPLSSNICRSETVKVSVLFYT